MAFLKVRQRSTLSQVMYAGCLEVESQQPCSSEYAHTHPDMSSSPASYVVNPSTPASLSPPRASTLLGLPLPLWRHRLENLLWIASAVFIIYYGDFRSNLFALLLTDMRVRRTPFNLGLACAVVDVGIFIYLAIRLRSLKDRMEVVTSGAIPAATLLGCSSFMLLIYALWPIWNFLTLPMLFTLFMALVVIAPCVGPFLSVKFDAEALRNLYIRPAE